MSIETRRKRAYCEKEDLLKELLKTENEVYFFNFSDLNYFFIFF